MAERITDKMLRKLCEDIAALIPERGFHIDPAYDMQRLEDNRGMSDSGYLSKRELYNWMRAYKAGIYAGRAHR